MPQEIDGSLKVPDLDTLRERGVGCINSYITILDEYGYVWQGAALVDTESSYYNSNIHGGEAETLQSYLEREKLYNRERDVDFFLLPVINRDSVDPVYVAPYTRY